MDIDNLSNSTCNDISCYNQSIQRNFSSASHSQTTIDTAVTILLLLSTQGTCGNCIVIYCIIKQRHLRQMTHIMAANFCVIGLITSAVEIPGHLFHLMLPGLPRQENDYGRICRVFGFVNLTLILATMANCSSIAVNRFLLITKPHLKHAMNAEKCVNTSVVIMWIISIMAALTSISYTGYNSSVLDCFIVVHSENHWYVISVLVVPTLISTLVVFVLYFLIFLKVLHSRRKVGAFQSKKQNKLKKIIQKQKQEKPKSSSDPHSHMKSLPLSKTIFTISHGQGDIAADPSSYFSDSCSTGFTLPSVHHPENSVLVKSSRTSAYRPQTFFDETESNQSVEETNRCEPEEHNHLQSNFLKENIRTCSSDEDRACSLPVSHQKLKCCPSHDAAETKQKSKTGILKKILCKEIRNGKDFNNSYVTKNCDAPGHLAKNATKVMNPRDTENRNGMIDKGISNLAFCSHDVSEQSSSNSTKNFKSEKITENNSQDGAFENIDLDDPEKENRGQTSDGCHDNKESNQSISKMDYNSNRKKHHRVSRNDSKRIKSSKFGRRLNMIEKEVRLSLYLFGAFIVFSALYLPITFLYVLHPMISISPDLWLTSYIAALSFSTFTWIFYGVMNRDIRKYFLLVLKCTKI